MQEVKRLTDVTPIIYTNESGANALNSLASKYQIWLVETCAPGSTCDPGAPIDLPPWKIDLLQYDWKGQVKGINGLALLDIFQNVQAAFQAKLIIGYPTSLSVSGSKGR
jgi:GH25 family lysozyme M1 (1,4-beta-N-acetylmuramidase)